APYFSLEETKELFKQFTDEIGAILEEGIVEDIFRRTVGHPGLTCFCGKQIHERLLHGQTFLSLRMEEVCHPRPPYCVAQFLGHLGASLTICAKSPIQHSTH